MPGPARAVLAWSVFGWVAPQRLTCIAIFRAGFQSAAPHGVTPCGVRQPQCQPCAGTTIAPPYRTPRCVALRVALRSTPCRELQNLAHSDVSRSASQRPARRIVQPVVRRVARRDVPHPATCRACAVPRLRGTALATCCALQRVAPYEVPRLRRVAPCNVSRAAMCRAFATRRPAMCGALRCAAPDEVPRPTRCRACDVLRLATCRALRCAGHLLRDALRCARPARPRPTICRAYDVLRLRRAAHCDVPNIGTRRPTMCRTLRCAAHCDVPRIATCCAPAHATPSPARWHRSERRDRDLEFPRMYLANSQISPIQMKWEE